MIMTDHGPTSCIMMSFFSPALPDSQNAGSWQFNHQDKYHARDLPVSVMHNPAEASAESFVAANQQPYYTSGKVFSQLRRISKSRNLQFEGCKLSPSASDSLDPSFVLGDDQLEGAEAATSDQMNVTRADSNQNMEPPDWIMTWHQPRLPGAEFRPTLFAGPRSADEELAANDPFHDDWQHWESS
mmetsp:Transcript_60867/g.162883  ORF Transcript_60867/g.162883 Transcript_60867/m.162883 type:complete len:185 (+) Transcript_60867:665-1219(+)